jgi:hypothetical protein
MVIEQIERRADQGALCLADDGQAPIYRADKLAHRTCFGILAGDLPHGVESALMR